MVLHKHDPTNLCYRFVLVKTNENNIVYKYSFRSLSFFLNMNPGCSLRCHLCGIPEPSLHCDICDRPSCKECEETHLSGGFTEHKLVPFKLRDCISKCQKHSSKMCDRYCEQCHIFVCE